MKLLFQLIALGVIVIWFIFLGSLSLGFLIGAATFLWPVILLVFIVQAVYLIFFQKTEKSQKYDETTEHYSQNFDDEITPKLPVQDEDEFEDDISLLDEFEDDIPHLNGKYITRYESGQIESEEYYKNDRRVGTWTTWFENGNISTQGSYIDGSKDGEWKEFFMDGRLAYTRSWEDGFQLRGDVEGPDDVPF